MWLDPIEAMLRRKINEEWTDNHRGVMRKLVAEGGWVQRRFCTISVAQTKRSVKDVTTKALGSTDLYHCSCWKPDPREIEEKETKNKDIKEQLEVAGNDASSERKPMGKEPPNSAKKRSPKSTKAGAS